MDRKKRILFVDDDADFVAPHKEVLEASGYEVLTASSGAEGLEMAKALRPDLMILDVMMATLTDGFETSRKVGEIPELKDLPVILMTGIREKQDLGYGFEPDDAWLPVKVVLEKPVRPERLLAEVAKHIR